MRLFSFICLALLFSLTHAANIHVTTVNDVFDTPDCNNTNNKGHDGLTSLREAVCMANAAKGADTIHLPAGEYALSLGAAEEDANMEGDLDISDTIHLLGADPATTTIKNDIGLPNIDGDGDRILEVLSMHTDTNLTIENITLTSSDLGCTEEECEVGGGTIHFDNDGSLTLINSVIEGNQNSCMGNDCGAESNTAVFTMLQGGELNLTGTTIQNNQTFCHPSPAPNRAGASETCEAGTNVLYAYNNSKGAIDFKFNVNNSSILNNQSFCHYEACEVGSIIYISGTIDYADMSFQQFNLTDNSLNCQGIDCSVDSLFYSQAELANLDAMLLDVSRNSLSCTATSCDTDTLFRIAGSNSGPNRGDQIPQDLTFNHATFDANVITCSGMECSTDELLIIDESDTITLNNTAVTNNQQTCFGEDCGTDELLEICCDAGSQSIINSVFANNIHHCEGEECDVDEIVDIGSHSIGAVVEVLNTQVIDNQATCVGLYCTCDVAGIYFRAEEGSNSIKNSTIARNISSGDDSSCLNRATGGIKNVSLDLLITNTTIHGNQTVGSGAGILNSGVMVLDHVTITDNQADTDNNGVGFGSGICNSFTFQGNDSCIGNSGPDSASLQMSNTILNNGSNLAPDCYGLIDSNGFNVVANDSNCSISGDYTATAALMAPLKDNGCIETLADGNCVQTQLAQESSPTIDAGSCFSGQLTDQRGVTRPFDVTAVVDVDDGCDIGAVETFSDLIFANDFED